MKYFGENIYQGNTNSQQATKEANAKLLFSIIQSNKQISRAELSRVSGLSRSTVSVLTENLIQENMIIEAGEGESEPTGRKPIMLEINPEGVQVPCFSFKQTGLLFVLYNLKYEVIEEQFVPYTEKLKSQKPLEGHRYTNPSQSEVIGLFESLINEKSEKIDMAKVKAICISFTGSFDWDNNTFSSAVLGWRFENDFIENLRTRLNNIPVLIGHDAALMGYAEKSNAKRDNLLYFLITENGAGAGIVLNNKVYSGENGISGQIGQSVVCRTDHAGNISCTTLEDNISQNALIRRAQDGIKSGKVTILSQLCDYNCERLTLEMIKKALNGNDDFTIQILKNAALEIGAAIANTLCILGSMDVFIGGGIEQLGDKFLGIIIETVNAIGYQRVLEHSSIQYSSLNSNGDCLGAVKSFVDNQLVVI